MSDIRLKTKAGHSHGLQMSWLLLLLILFQNLSITVTAQTTATSSSSFRSEGDSTIRIMFYNIENTFDHRNDPYPGDDSFLPGSERAWTFWKYRQKLIAVGRVILSAGGWEPPELIGLEEVENRRVLEDLLRLSPLRLASYGLVHFDSPDPRGIDVALLYRKDRIRILFARPLRYNLAEHGMTRTRDILYACVEAFGRDTLHIYVNHWPSRFGGHLTTNSKRLASARRLAQDMDSLLAQQPNACLVAGGDFNDEPHDSSLCHIEGKYDIRPRLINLMKEPARVPGSGSHKHAGHWGFLDQILISPNLADDNHPLRLSSARAQVLTARFLLKKEVRNPGYTPFRSFAGQYYQGGISDHLPVWIELVRDKEPHQAKNQFP